MVIKGRQFPSSRRGSIIVMVLVFVVLLTFIVTAFLDDATSRIKYYGLFHNRDDLRLDAYSALDSTLAVLNTYREAEGKLWGPAQGWASPLEAAGFKPLHASVVRVHFDFESSRIPLASLDRAELMVLFDMLGFDLSERESLTDGYLDWTDDDDERQLNGFDGDDYESLDPPYRPANGPVQSWDEFRLIVPFNELFWDEQGTPTAAWRQFREAVSLYHTGAIDINHASATVKNFLLELNRIDTYALDDYLNGVDGELGTEDDRYITNENSGASLITETAEDVGTGIELLRVRVEALRGEARFQLEGLVTWSGANPGAGVASDTGDNNAEQPEDLEPDPNDESASARRERARGNTQTEPATVAQLGYPFRFLLLTENRKF
jgi:hypothetical protein